MSSSLLFTEENITHFSFLVNRQKIEGKVEDRRFFDVDFFGGGEEKSVEYRKMVYHNRCNGYILKRLHFLTNYDK